MSFPYDTPFSNNNKADLDPYPTVPVINKVMAGEFNTLTNGVNSLATAITAGTFIGFVGSSTAAVAPAGGVRLRAGTQGLELSYNGLAYQRLVGVEPPTAYQTVLVPNVSAGSWSAGVIDYAAELSDPTDTIGYALTASGYMVHGIGVTQLPDAVADLVSTATPFLSAALTGKEVTLSWSGPFNWVLSDDSILPGSALRLATGSTITMTPGSLLKVIYSDVVGWIETFRWLAP